MGTKTKERPVNDQFDPSVIGPAIGGAIAAGLANRSNDTLKRRVFDGISGALVGIVTGPAVADAVGIANDHTRAALYFGLAAVGWVIVSFAVDWAKNGGIKGLAQNWLSRFGVQPKP